MQVEFDATYLAEDSEAQKKLKNRNKMINSHKQAIADIKMTDAQDYEALTSLYRKIFRFLLEFAPNNRHQHSDKNMEREVAAALESVFPRVGLKTFISLEYEDKMTQLMELNRIILGIRLFNRFEGRGGSGIDDMDKDSMILASILQQDIEKEMGFFQDACSKYQQAIIRAYLFRRKKKFMVKEMARQEKEAEENDSPNAQPPLNTYSFDQMGVSQDPNQIIMPIDQQSTLGNSIHHRHGLKSNEMFLISQLEDVNDYVIERWSQELANRRQYLNFLKSLLDEIKYINSKLSTLIEKLKLELTTIKSLISNKTSVPKEVVYPRFDALGSLWVNLFEEVIVLIARSNTFQALCKYRLSFSPTLADELFGDEEDKSVKRSSMTMESVMLFDENSLADGKSTVRETTEGLEEPEPIKPFESVESSYLNTTGLEEYALSGAQLLSIENTPDFALLPLELQGFCPWTIVEARGLLIPGKPSLGIVRYENQYYVCDHIMAIKAFMEKPEYYLNAIKTRALKNPEFIHLLNLQKWFPTTSIAKLLHKHEMEINNQTGQPLTKDAATETPTHFIESYIDLNYHWNEWELRKRALKMVNLKNCRTSGQQTDQSHFRRDNESQVYIPKVADTQTKRDKGTNPPIVTTYIQGLRGVEDVAESKDSNGLMIRNAHKGSKDNKDYKSAKDDKEFHSRQIAHPKVSVVKLTLDL